MYVWRKLETREAGDANRFRLHHGVTFLGFVRVLGRYIIQEHGSQTKPGFLKSMFLIKSLTRAASSFMVELQPGCLGGPRDPALKLDRTTCCQRSLTAA